LETVEQTAAWADIHVGVSATTSASDAEERSELSLLAHARTGVRCPRGNVLAVRPRLSPGRERSRRGRVGEALLISHCWSPVPIPTWASSIMIYASLLQSRPSF
jgi:hypothetical protein